MCYCCLYIYIYIRHYDECGCNMSLLFKTFDK